MPTTNDANCDCHEPKSPFSFTDRLNGINESLLFLMGTCILYMGLLILIEVSTGCPIWMGWISKLYYREAMYILELSKAPFLMIRAYILFFEEIFNF